MQDSLYSQGGGTRFGVEWEKQPGTEYAGIRALIYKAGL